MMRNVGIVDFIIRTNKYIDVNKFSCKQSDNLINMLVNIRYLFVNQ